MPLLQYRDFMTNPRFLNFPSNFSSALKSFLSTCLQVEPEKRKSAKDLLEHPFVKKFESTDISLFKEWLNTVIKKNLAKAKENAKKEQEV